MQKRAGKMNQLDVRGMLPGNKQFEANLRHEQGRPRLLIARSTDAGQVFKLVGFYPHAVGGDMNLDVNLDGQGVAERTGLLTATRFHVLGDAISVQNLPNETAAAAGATSCANASSSTPCAHRFPSGTGSSSCTMPRFKVRW